MSSAYLAAGPLLALAALVFRRGLTLREALFALQDLAKSLVPVILQAGYCLPAGVREDRARDRGES
ncbi:hypothetical protein L6R52_13950 [Myxococcota bacterium]|nr:hypothetical protein [Myxococcota bacterium]